VSLLERRALGDRPAPWLTVHHLEDRVHHPRSWPSGRVHSGDGAVDDVVENRRKSARSAWKSMTAILLFVTPIRVGRLSRRQAQHPQRTDACRGRILHVVVGPPAISASSALPRAKSPTKTAGRPSIRRIRASPPTRATPWSGPGRYPWTWPPDRLRARPLWDPWTGLGRHRVRPGVRSADRRRLGQLGRGTSRQPTRPETPAANLPSWRQG
jgi:hypothetical protein